MDGLQEMEKGKKSLGTTKKGIGPTYASKATRNGLRLADLLGDFNTFKEKLVQFFHLFIFLMIKSQASSQNKTSIHFISYQIK